MVQGSLVGADAPKIGWPSLHIVKFSTTMKSVGVNLLGIVSKRASRVLKPTNQAEIRTGGRGVGMNPQISSLVGKVCFCRWASLCFSATCLVHKPVALMNCDCTLFV